MLWYQRPVSDQPARLGRPRKGHLRRLPSIRRGKPLNNARYERIAQLTAEGRHTRLEVWAETYETQLTADQRRVWVQKQHKRALSKIEYILYQPEVKARIEAILVERHDRRMNIQDNEVLINADWIKKGLIENIGRAMQAVPVLDREGRAIGVYKSDYKAANEGFKLLGLDLGMFAQQHKHLHGAINPLEGNREDLLGRLRVLTDMLSDADLAGLGLQRIGTVEVRSQRVEGMGDEPGATISAVS